MLFHLSIFYRPTKGFVEQLKIYRPTDEEMEGISPSSSPASSPPPCIDFWLLKAVNVPLNCVLAFEPLSCESLMEHQILNSFFFHKHFWTLLMIAKCTVTKVTTIHDVKILH